MDAPGFRGPMKFPKLKTLGLGVGLFVVVYVPAFTTVALVRPRIEIAIPLIIAITLFVALLLIFLLARSPAGIAEFGFHIPHSRYVVSATLFGLTIGLAVTFLSHLFPSKPPFDVSRFAPWMIGLYFIIGSPIQEEIVFRGLIQSMVERRWQVSFSLFGGSLSGAVAFSAALFGVIHFESGAIVALGAIILGLVAGELRRRSGSLLPAIIVHALFNAADAFWPQR
jgi:membrane protease YdiL (CAAX protease family)